MIIEPGTYVMRLGEQVTIEKAETIEQFFVALISGDIFGQWDHTGHDFFGHSEFDLVQKIN